MRRKAKKDTEDVAAAVAERMKGHPGALSLTVILDADPAVYRLGYGDMGSLIVLRDAAKAANFDLRAQDGIRIGIVISDAVTMIYSPVPRYIAAVSPSDKGAFTGR